MERFAGHYDEWTENRLAWILRTFGDDVFEGRTVLDIGGGTGHVARRALDFGARAVEVVEGRLENIRAAEPRDGLTFTHANLERGLTSAAQSYDIVINFGTLYHVVNWETLLVESVACARELAFVETEVIDSESEATHYLIEDWRLYDQALSGVGTRPSEFEIDRLLARVPNAQARKALDPALNAEFHRYDWQNRLEGLIENGLRRFWSVERAPSPDERAGVDALLTAIHHGKAIDTLVIARRTQDLVERALGRPAAPPPLPPDPLDARDLLGVQGRLEPLRAALEPVEDGDPLDVRRALPGIPGRRSCTDEEGLALYQAIVANGLRSGFEIGTGFGYATAFVGLAMQRTRGSVISMDSHADGEDLQQAVATVLDGVERGEHPPSLVFAGERLSALGLDDVVTLSIGISPDSVPEAIWGRGIDFALIDGGRSGDQPAQDLEAVLPQLDGRCIVAFFRGDDSEPETERAIARAEEALQTRAFAFPTRRRLTLVARGLDQAAVAALDRLFLRARA